MIIRGPKWVRKANQWCVTTIEPTSGMSSKHSIKQTLYWFSSNDEAGAIAKINELGEKNGKS